MKIWKYKIDGNDVLLSVPRGAKILSLQMQEQVPCIWMLVDHENGYESRRFIVHITGSFADIREDVDKYIGTFQNGWFVGHVFERIQK